jgi:Domain of unknown function (DUF4114)
LKRFLLGMFVVALACASVPARADFNVVFGTSWDGPSFELQQLVDARYGAGNINVATDYIGADAGDPDPWYWVDAGFSALVVTEVAGNADFNVVGWYKETGGLPTIDNSDDGVIFTGPADETNPPVLVGLPGSMNFGFYMNPNGSGGSINAPEPEHFFTNRTFNDIGPDGSGALHEPLGGDVQALVYDVSAFRGPNTWLVCFEDLDSGAVPADCCAPTDNDFNDFVFEVTAVGATPVRPLSFGGLKQLYR